MRLLHSNNSKYNSKLAVVTLLMAAIALIASGYLMMKGV
jgi:hypothetical protein